MRIKERALAKTILRALKTFPAVVVTGPRQSGKTTLLKKLFSKTHRFVSLEDPDVRLRAKEDPLAFLERYKPPVILDEIQYVPELLSYIKTRIDKNRKAGQWLLTGSQNFTLMAGVTQSLAGRAAILSLLPFSYSERIGQGQKTKTTTDWLKNLDVSLKKSRSTVSLSELLLRGFYPEIASHSSVDRTLWCGSYIATYLERDVRNLTQVGDLNQFERFLKLCAIRTGQILNLSEMAREIGISVPTAKRWLSVLETGYIVYLLYPYYRNLSKRLVKSPKLYFCDTALASYLLGLNDAETLLNSPHFGSLFETMVVDNILKRFLHSGESPSMYYWRTRDGLEVDLVLEAGGKLYLFEVKSAVTVVPKHAMALERIRNEFPSLIKKAAVISRSPENFALKRLVMNYRWQDILGI